MMWHIVKWASIMHTPPGWGGTSPNASYFSLMLSDAARSVRCDGRSNSISLQWDWLTNRVRGKTLKMNWWDNWMFSGFLTPHIVYFSFQHMHGIQNTYWRNLKEELLKHSLCSHISCHTVRSHPCFLTYNGKIYFVEFLPCGCKLTLLGHV